MEQHWERQVWVFSYELNVAEHLHLVPVVSHYLLSKRPLNVVTSRVTEDKHPKPTDGAAGELPLVLALVEHHPALALHLSLLKIALTVKVSVD